MSQPKPKITPIALVHVLKSALCLDEDTYRAMLAEYGVESSKDLRPAQLKVFTHDLEDKAVAAGVWTRKQWAPRPAATPRAKGANVAHIARPDELAKVNAVAALIDWHADNGLALFLEKRMAITGGKVKTSAEAYRAIEGLKKLFENTMKRQHGDLWWTLSFKSDAVEEYINRHAPAEHRSPITGKIFKRAAAKE